MLHPNAWLEAFGISAPEEQTKWNNLMIKRVRALEERAHKIRLRDKKSVIGRQRLINQKLDIYYRPKRKGKRMCCLSEDRKQRISFINYLKDLFKAAKAVQLKWLTGDYSIPYPIGLYPPSLPKLANLFEPAAFA